MSISASVYSPVEQQKIVELRKNVSDLIAEDSERGDDSFLIRWLRARNLDVKKAEEMLRTSMEWRKANEIDGIDEREPIPQEFLDDCPFAWCGNIQDGTPLFLGLFGRQDMRKFVEKYGKEKCFKIQLANMEKIYKMIKNSGKEQGKVITQLVEILDFEGYSYRQLSSKACRDFLVETQKVVDANYPELLKHVIIVNAPKIFAILFAVMKSFISKQTLEKVEIYGPDKSKWQKAIAEKYPMDKIPPHWGGTLKGIDEFCSGHEIWIQGPSDLAGFIRGTKKVEDETDLIQVTIDSRDKIVKELQVQEKGSVIEWKFKTDGYDIGFEVTYGNFTDGENEGINIIQYARINSHQELQYGSHTCLEAGVYKFVFDNSYSLIKSKCLKYYIAVITPEADFKDCVEDQ